MRIYGKLKMSFPALSEGNEKATQFSERMQTAKYPVGRTAFRVSALLEVEMPKCASPKSGTKNPLPLGERICICLFCNFAVSP